VNVSEDGVAVSLGSETVKVTGTVSGVFAAPVAVIVRVPL
jgi:hypothetical protein